MGLEEFSLFLLFVLFFVLFCFVFFIGGGGGGSFVFLCFYPFFFLEDRQGHTTASYCKNGEFHSDPVCTDPVQNFPKLGEIFCRALR